MKMECFVKPIVLIADSDAELCDRCRRFLGEHGYEVETAPDGLDCLEKLRRVRPAALVLDLDLRWGGGDGVLAWLREGNAVTGVAVVLTAAADSPADVATHVRPPVVTFLPKPFAPAALLKTVRAAVAGKGRGEPFDRNRTATCSELYIG
jgi:DNA-binding response OmpR family regulator